MNAIDVFLNFTEITAQLEDLERLGKEELLQESRLNDIEQLTALLAQRIISEGVKESLESDSEISQFCTKLVASAQEGNGAFADLYSRINQLRKSILKPEATKPPKKEITDELIRKHTSFDEAALIASGLPADMIRDIKNEAKKQAAFAIMEEDFKNFLSDHDLVNKTIVGDGNCFFRAISASLHHNDNSTAGQADYAALRAQAIHALEAKLNANTKELSALEHQETLSLEELFRKTLIESEITAIRARIAIASRDHEFAESPEIEALSTELKLPIIILSWHGDEDGPFALPEGEKMIREHMINCERFSETLPVVLMHKINHYDLAARA